MKLAAAALLGVTLTACTLPQSLRAEHLLTGTPAAAYQGAVAIHLDGQPPPASFEEVAVVSATGMGYRANLASVLGALQAEAASLGANAIIRVRYDHGADEATATGVAVRVR